MPSCLQARLKSSQRALTSPSSSSRDRLELVAERVQVGAYVVAQMVNAHLERLRRTLAKADYGMVNGKHALSDTVKRLADLEDDAIGELPLDVLAGEKVRVLRGQGVDCSP